MALATWLQAVLRFGEGRLAAWCRFLLVGDTVGGRLHYGDHQRWCLSQYR
jgi:hypothetical protein